MCAEPVPPSSGSPARTLVQCPTCKKLVAYSLQNRWRPFCSERCKMIDLGAWSAEEYRMAARQDGTGAEES